MLLDTVGSQSCQILTLRFVTDRVRLIRLSMRPIDFNQYRLECTAKTSFEEIDVVMTLPNQFENVVALSLSDVADEEESRHVVPTLRGFSLDEK